MSSTSMCILRHGFLFLFLCSGTLARDAASEQLERYAKTHKEKPSIIQTRYGVPVPDVTASLTAGPRGPMLLQDVIYLDTMANFGRERIPVRVVHAPGSGAFGYFEVTNDITKYTKAKLFSSVGKKTRIAVRFSMGIHEKGTPETVRDARGFAVKFYTEDGIFDLVGFNTPVFFISDPMLVPLVTHALGRNPVTNIKLDSDMMWDFMTLRPETARALLFLFSDEGIPDGYRHMSGYGQHAFKMVNDKNDAVYIKFHYLTDQGEKNMLPEDAAQMTIKDPDYMTRDLYNAIEDGKYPTWTMSIQVMTFKQAETFRWNPFDVTKEWPVEEYPLIEVGKIVLNENPTNYFEQVEQIAFSPAHMVPGIEPSPDKMLQGRLFAYSDTQRYRLGGNHLQFPVNCPFGGKISNYQRDGPQVFNNQGKGPNYYPNSFGGPVNAPGTFISKFNITGDVERYYTGDGDHFSQATTYWHKKSNAEQERILDSITLTLKGAAQFLQDRAVNDFFKKVDPKMAVDLKKRLEMSK